MEPIARKSDGRRVFSAEFKREQIERVVRGELTISELSRELGISRALLARWKSLITSGAETAVRANESVVPASELKVAQQQIRELQRLLGKKEVELEILRAARDEVKKRPHFYGVSKK
ncbi:MAG: transposase [Gaiellaceae bacterium]